MTPVFAALVVLVSVLVAAYIYKQRHMVTPGWKVKTTIPGLESNDPQNGNYAEIATAGSLHELLVKLHKTHGPIVSFWFGPKFTVSVADPEMFKDLKAVFDRPPELFRLFEPLMGPESIQFANGFEGHRRRKLTDPSWSHDMLRHFCESFNELGEEMSTKLSSLPKMEHIPLSQYTLALTIKGLSQTSFGNYFKDDKHCHNMKHNYDICWKEMEARLSGAQMLEGSERQKRYDEALGNMRAMVKEIVQERKENPPKPHERAFIDLLMENEDIYDESKLLAEATTYMVAGFHTSGFLLCWTIYYLTLNQEVQEKVYQEVLRVAGSKESIGPEDITKFQYMKQVMDESLRLSILAPWAAKVQEVDISLGGHFIPKGTPVITALGVMSQDEKIWPNPKKFDPDRFSPENVKGRHQFAFQPFGLPGRICPGCRFALYELTVLLAILIRNFKWTLVEGQMVESVHGLVTSPKEEIWVHIEKRQ
ncbi:cytochrome P450 20A1-like [Apostichopus japonicus]|uniref:cytochrome P450 20A1-like n=1 Tax=Stichopus japonicus TaxID=307972 RepID=UPI003AB483F0